MDYTEPVYNAKVTEPTRDLDCFLQDLALRIAETLSDDLVGVYVFGSVALNDYLPPQSDVDVLVVSRESLSLDTKSNLVFEIRSVSETYPAIGLDLIVTSVECVTTLPKDPTFELSIAIGKDWVPETEFGGPYEAILLDLEIARRCGIALYGPSPGELISTVPFERLGPIVRGTIDWHRDHVFDDFHDPLGHYAILNTCRALRYFDEDALCSKSEAARWAQERFPQNEVISEAAKIRSGTRHEPLDRSAIEEFLTAAAGHIDAKPSKNI